MKMGLRVGWGTEGLGSGKLQDEKATTISILQATFHTLGSWGWVGKGRVRVR